jgi:hypothetical protein
MITPLRISCSVDLPLPANFTLHPLLHSKRLSAVADHRYFYPSALIITLLWLICAAVPFGDSLAWLMWTLHSMYLLAIVGLIPIILTQVDRRIWRLLCRNFEYGLLIGQVIVIGICFIVLATKQSAFVLLQNFISLCVFSFTLSMDAVVGVSRVGKGCVLAGNLIIFASGFAYTHLQPATEQSDTNVSIFFYRTTVLSILGSATVTLTLFVCKYLFYVIFRPGRMLILTSHIAFSVERDAVEELQVHSTPSRELSAALMEVVVEDSTTERWN